MTKIFEKRYFLEKKERKKEKSRKTWKMKIF